MFNSQNLQEKWAPVLEHADLAKIEPLITSQSAGGSSPIAGSEVIKVVWKQDEWNVDVQCEAEIRVQNF